MAQESKNKYCAEKSENTGFIPRSHQIPIYTNLLYEWWHLLD